MTDSQIRASLRVWHPTMPAQTIYKSFNLKLVRQWSYGEPRTTPKGNPLDGIHKETYCCFELVKTHSKELSDVLRSANEELARSSELVKEVVDTGGRIEYYISFSVGVGLEFDSALISEFSALKVSLSIEAL